MEAVIIIGIPGASLVDFVVAGVIAIVIVSCMKPSRVMVRRLRRKQGLGLDQPSRPNKFGAHYHNLL